MRSRFNSVHFSAIATALPSETLELESLGPVFGEEYVRRVIASTGVEQVHVAPRGTTASDLCFLAAKSMMEKESLLPQDFDALVFVSQSPDYVTPSTSPSLQARLGLSTDTACMDLNFGCSGFVYGLLQACMLCSLDSCRRVMLLVGDVQTPFVNQRDKSLRMVIGDGASATLVEKGDKVAFGAHFSDGTGVEHLYIPAGGRRKPYTAESGVDVLGDDGNYRSDLNLHMNGSEILKFAMGTVPGLIENLLADANWPKEQVDLFVLHQANKLILESIRRKLKVPTEKVPVKLRSTGNTSPTTIPMALSKMREDGEDLNRLDRVVLCGFGIGLSYGAIATSLQGCHIHSPIYV